MRGRRNRRASRARWNFVSTFVFRVHTGDECVALRKVRCEGFAKRCRPLIGPGAAFPVCGAHSSPNRTASPSSETSARV